MPVGSADRSLRVCVCVRLVFCIQSLINGEKMSESKQCRNMFLLAGGSLALLMLLPNPWLYLYAS